MHCLLFLALDMFGSLGVSLASLAMPYVLSYLVKSRYGFACTSDVSGKMWHFLYVSRGIPFSVLGSERRDV